MENLLKIRTQIKKTVPFFHDVWHELKKVRWPNRKELFSYTWVVIVTVSLLSLFFALIDLGLSQIIQLILG